MSTSAKAWPSLDFAQDQSTIETLHLLLQLIGKMPLRLHPWINHGWHVALRMTPRGTATRLLEAGERRFSLELDWLEGAIRVHCNDGWQMDLPIAGKPIAQVHGELAGLLIRNGLPAPLYGAPNEIPDPIPFAKDDRARDWDPATARRLHAAFLRADQAFTTFRAQYRGKVSPSHLFWGSFDLAVTRFSGRTAPVHPGGVPHLSDDVTREAYSHEVISAGFWPGSAAFPHAAFYAYAYPVPAGLDRAALGQGSWNAQLGEFLLPYADVQAADDPEGMVATFLRDSYHAAAALMDWPEGLDLPAKPTFGHPPA